MHDDASSTLSYSSRPRKFQRRMRRLGRDHEYCIATDRACFALVECICGTRSRFDPTEIHRSSIRTQYSVLAAILRSYTAHCNAVRPRSVLPMFPNPALDRSMSAGHYCRNNQRVPPVYLIWGVNELFAAVGSADFTVWEASVYQDRRLDSSACHGRRSRC